MSTELMSQFLEGLHDSRLLENDRVEELRRMPESPQGDVDGMARFLEGQGWLTRYQIDEIRQGRGQGLMFSGYRLLEKLPDGPSGQSFKAYHPALQQAVVVRWINADWLAPNDDPRGFIERARAASAVSHPNLVNILDAGFVGETPFIVHELVDGANLWTLVSEMGALPVPLACDYIRQAATALTVAHERGIFHGNMSPARLLLAPVIRKPAQNGTGQPVLRPAAGAIIRVAGLGLSPRRPPAGQASATEGQLLSEVPFLPPERLTSSAPDMRGEIYSLGATLYYLLAARPPFAGVTPSDVLQQVPRATPARIDGMRKDASAALADLIGRMISKDPAARPSNATSVAQYLLPFSPNQAPEAAPAEPAYAIPVASETDTRPNSLPAVMASVVPPLADDVHEPLVEALPAGTRDSQVYSPVTARPSPLEDHHDMFADHPTAKPRPLKPRPKVKGGWTWLILGACLHVTAVTTVVLYYFEIWPFGKSVPTYNEKKIEKPPQKVKKQTGP